MARICSQSFGRSLAAAASHAGQLGTQPSQNQPVEENQGNDDFIALELGQKFANGQQLGDNRGYTRGNYHPDNSSIIVFLQNIEPGRSKLPIRIFARRRKAILPSGTDGLGNHLVRAVAPTPGAKKWRWHGLCG
jgi:hypothetical protein